MNVTRKPLQIIFVEHIFYPVMVAIFIALSYTYAIKISVIYSDTPPHQIGAIIALVLMAITNICLYIILPFSCYRLWISANKYLSGYKNIIYKIYAGCLFLVLVFFGFMSLLDLPNIIENAGAIFENPNK